MSATPAAFAPISDSEYKRRTEAVFSAIESAVDRFLDEDVIDIDANRTGGLLELAFPNDSRIVVNTQPPLQEIWLAAQSGGFHFKPALDAWIDGRDGGEFFARLSLCASQQAGRELRFEP